MDEFTEFSLDDYLDACGAVTPRENLTIVGSVHVSEATRERVLNTIWDRQPEVVAIELDDERLGKLQTEQQSKWEQMVKQLVAGDLDWKGIVATLILFRMNSKYTDLFDHQPGHADMLPAVDAASTVDSEVALIDELGDDRLNNIGKGLVTNVKQLLGQLQEGNVVDVAMKVEKLRRAKRHLNPEELDSPQAVVERMEEMSYAEIEDVFGGIDSLLPAVAEELVHQRDRKMAGHLEWLARNDQHTVAVMGKAHVPGVLAYLADPVTIPAHCIEAPPQFDPTERYQ